MSAVWQQCIMLQVGAPRRLGICCTGAVSLAEVAFGCFGQLTRPCQLPRCPSHSLRRGCGAARLAAWAPAPGAAALSVRQRRTGGKCPCGLSRARRRGTCRGLSGSHDTSGRFPCSCCSGRARAICGRRVSLRAWYGERGHTPIRSHRDHWSEQSISGEGGLAGTANVERGRYLGQVVVCADHGTVTRKQGALESGTWTASSAASGGYNATVQHGDLSHQGRATREVFKSGRPLQCFRQARLRVLTLGRPQAGRHQCKRQSEACSTRLLHLSGTHRHAGHS